MKYRIFLTAFVFLVAGSSYAGIAPWTITPLTSTKLELAKNSTSTVQYRVTNNSAKTFVLAMKYVPWIRQTTTAGKCSNPFTLSGGDSCILEFEVDGRLLNSSVVIAPEVCNSGSALQCYKTTAGNSLNISLTNSISVASLQVLNTQLDLFAGGPIKTLVIKNTSTNLTATNLFLNFVGTPLEGTVETVSGTCTSVAPQGSCLLRFKPILPLTQNTRVATATLESLNQDSDEISIRVAEYSVGDSYQGGVIGCLSEIDELQSFIAATSDAFADGSTLIRWGGYRQQTDAQSDADGASNTDQIISILGNNDGSTYAAQVCDNYSNDGYTDWYMPAKDQVNCLYTNRSAVGGFDSRRYYWSSTELADSSDDRFYAWIQYFSNGDQIRGRKDNFDPVRCVRAIG